MSLAKPVMRRLLAKRIKIQMTLAFTVSFSVGYLYKYLVGDPTKQAYIEFYKTYDDDKCFNSMREAGVFEGVQPVEK